MVAVAVAVPKHRIIDRPLPEGRRAKLRVISGVPEGEPKQVCAGCPNIVNCWQAGIEPRVVVLNLLVCRMKTGVEQNESTRLFLELIRPKLAKMAMATVLDTGHDAETVLHDFESQAVDYILRHYKLGEVAYPLHYLFGFPNGALRRYAHTYRERLQKHAREVSSVGFNAADDSDLRRMNMAATGGQIRAAPPAAILEPTQDEGIDDRKVTQRMDAARDVLSDGKTLTLEEYRVLKFCLTNAKDGGFKRPLNGLHVFMSKAMDLPRAKVTKIFSDACQKLVRGTQARGLV